MTNLVFLERTKEKFNWELPIPTFFMYSSKEEYVNDLTEKINQCIEKKSDASLLFNKLYTSEELLALKEELPNFIYTLEDFLEKEKTNNDLFPICESI